jgi:hypothetical protein
MDEQEKEKKNKEKLELLCWVADLVFVGNINLKVLLVLVLKIRGDSTASKFGNLHRFSQIFWYF